MATTNQTERLKVLLTGDRSAGKRSLIARMLDDEMPTGFAGSGLDPQFRFKTVPIGGEEVRFEVWYTIPASPGMGITPAISRGCRCALLVYDVTNRDSFTHLTDYMEELDRTGGSYCGLIVVGTKADREGERAVSRAEGIELATSWGAPFHEVSALTGVGVRELFAETTMTAVRQRDAERDEERLLSAPPAAAAPSSSGCSVQ